MDQFITSAWMLSTLLLFTGVAVAFSGVGIFGWHFIWANGRAAQEPQGSYTTVAWGGMPAKLGLKILAAGVLTHLSGFFLGMALSGLA
jgi:hypothetical protein